MSRSKNSRRGIRMARPYRELWGRGPLCGYDHNGENKRLARRIVRARHAQQDLTLVEDVREGPLHFLGCDGYGDTDCGPWCRNCRDYRWSLDTDGEPRERWLLDAERPPIRASA